MLQLRSITIGLVIFLLIPNTINADGRFEDADLANDFLSSSVNINLKYDLRHTIPGEPDIDYPIYRIVPNTSFECKGHHEGYYADVETRCQAFRICTNTDLKGTGFAFLCPNGTLFSQKDFVCDWYRNVNCNESKQFYHKNSAGYMGNSNEIIETVRQMIEHPMKTIVKAFGQKQITLQQRPNAPFANKQPYLRESTKNSPIQSVPIRKAPVFNDEIVSAGTTSAKPNTNSSLRVPSDSQHSPLAQVDQYSTASSTAKHTITNKVYVSSLGELSTDPSASFDQNTAKINPDLTKRNVASNPNMNFAEKINAGLFARQEVFSNEEVIAPDYVKILRKQPYQHPSLQPKPSFTELAGNINGLLDEVAGEAPANKPTRNKSFRFLSRGFLSQREEPYHYDKPTTSNLLEDKILKTSTDAPLISNNNTITPETAIKASETNALNSAASTAITLTTSTSSDIKELAIATLNPVSTLLITPPPNAFPHSTFRANVKTSIALPNLKPGRTIQTPSNGIRINDNKSGEHPVNNNVSEIKIQKVPLRLQLDASSEATIVPSYRVARVQEPTNYVKNSTATQRESKDQQASGQLDESDEEKIAVNERAENLLLAGVKLAVLDNNVNGNNIDIDSSGSQAKDSDFSGSSSVFVQSSKPLWINAEEVETTITTSSAITTPSIATTPSAITAPTAMTTPSTATTPTAITTPSATTTPTAMTTESTATTPSTTTALNTTTTPSSTTFTNTTQTPTSTSTPPAPMITSTEMVTEISSSVERIRSFQRFTVKPRQTTTTTIASPVFYAKRDKARSTPKIPTSTKPPKLLTTRRRFNRVIANLHRDGIRPKLTTKTTTSTEPEAEKKLFVRNVGNGTDVSSDQSAVSSTSYSASVRSESSNSIPNNSRRYFQQFNRQRNGYRYQSTTGTSTTTRAPAVTRSATLRPRNRLTLLKARSSNTSTTPAPPTTILTTSSLNLATASPSNSSSLIAHLSSSSPSSSLSPAVSSHKPIDLDSDPLTKSSAYISFDKLTQAIVDDSILQNYRNSQTPTTPKPSTTVFGSEFLATRQPAFALGHIPTAKEPSQLIAPQKPQRTYQHPSVHSQAQAQRQSQQLAVKVESDSFTPRIVIAKSEGHSTQFPNSLSSSKISYETVNQAVKASSNKEQYVPLDDFLSNKFRNFQKQSQNTNRFSQLSQRPQNNKLQQLQQIKSGQYSSDQNRKGYYHPTQSQSSFGNTFSHASFTISPSQKVTEFPAQRHQQQQQHQQQQHQQQHHQQQQQPHQQQHQQQQRPQQQQPHQQQQQQLSAAQQQQYSQIFFSNSRPNIEYQQHQQYQSSYPNQVGIPSAPSPQFHQQVNTINARQFPGSLTPVGSVNVFIPTVPSGLIPNVNSQIAQRRIGNVNNLAFDDETASASSVVATAKSAYSGVSSYDVPLNSVGRLQNDITQQRR